MKTPATILSSHTSGWLTAKALRFPAGFSLPTHRHEDACIQVVLNGVFYEQGWGRRSRFSPGEALFRPTGFEHANDQGHDFSDGLSLQFHSIGLPGQIEEWIKQSGPSIANNPHVSLLANRIRSEMALPDVFTSAIIDAMCVGIVVHVVRSVTARPGTNSATLKLAEKAAEIIALRATGPLTVDVVAELVGVDRFQLNRAFHVHKGCCPSEYIRLCRIRHVQRLLIQTDRSIASIAIECGFADQSHLTKVFTSIVGKSPARFRAQPPGN